MSCRTDRQAVATVMAPFMERWKWNTVSDASLHAMNLKEFKLLVISCRPRYPCFSASIAPRSNSLNASSKCSTYRFMASRLCSNEHVASRSSSGIFSDIIVGGSGIGRRNSRAFLLIMERRNMFTFSTRLSVNYFLDFVLLCDASWFIGEPLALHPQQRRLGAPTVVHAQRDSVVVAELKFRQIAVKVLLVAMLIDTLHAALEQAKVAFDGVGVDRCVLERDVLTLAVVDRIVAGELLTNLVVVLGLVGHQPRFAGNVLPDDAADLLAGHGVDVDGADLAAALHQPEDGVLVARAALRGRDAFLAADERLVGLDCVPEAVTAAERAKAAIAHGLADAMAQEPRALERDAEQTVELVGADALFGRAKQMERLEPLVERNVAVLENRADLDGELLTAGGALAEADPSARTFQSVCAADDATVRAYRAIRPQHRLDMLIGGLLALKPGCIEKGR